MSNHSPAINELASAVFDNGRRGNPKPGCDCEQCFGYCLRDRDISSNRPTFERTIRPYSLPLNFDE